MKYCKRKNIKLIAWVLLFSIAVTGCGKKTAIDLNSEDSDSQPYWNVHNHHVTKGDDGYYYIYTDMTEMDGWEQLVDYIMYFDYENNVSVPLCGKADCRHNVNTCNAILDGPGYMSQGIWYYRDKLYIVVTGARANGGVGIEEISKDGSERKRICTVDEYSERTGIFLAFLDDCAYMYDRVGYLGTDIEVEETIIKCSLDGKTQERICSNKAKGARVSTVKGYSGKLFYTMDSSKYIEYEEVPLLDIVCEGLFMYNPKDKTTQKVLDKNITDYTIDVENNNIYYYVSGKGLYMSSLDNLEESKLLFKSIGIETLNCDVSTDGKYLYLCNENMDTYLYKKVDGYMWVLDLEGNELNKIATQGAYTTMFGDEKCVFSYNRIRQSGFRYIKKSEIETATEWTIMN